VTPTDSELRDFLAVGALRVGDYFCFEAHAFWTFFGLRDPGFSDEDPDAEARWQLGSALTGRRLAAELVPLRPGIVDLCYVLPADLKPTTCYLNRERALQIISHYQHARAHPH
jgi:hypothetical protein